MNAYRILTVSSGEVSPGAEVGTLTLKGAGVEIPVILVGETGRGRERGVVAVHLPSAQYAAWKRGERVVITAAEVGETRSGKPKLFAKDRATSGEMAICVFRTKIGYRGGNSHTGDRTGGVVEDSWSGERLEFHPFPGEILVEGKIAQGAAGGMGSGAQLVAVMPQGVVFRTSYSGRLYGAPSAHYYMFDGNGITAVTWEEREVADLWFEDFEAEEPEEEEPEAEVSAEIEEASAEEVAEPEPEPEVEEAEAAEIPAPEGVGITAADGEIWAVATSHHDGHYEDQVFFFRGSDAKERAEGFYRQLFIGSGTAVIAKVMGGRLGEEFDYEEGGW